MRVLVIAPHADDETLGMGGTIARLADEGHEVHVAVLTGHGDLPAHPLGGREIWTTVRAEFEKACGVLGVQAFYYEELPAVMVAEQPMWEVNAIATRLVERVGPEVLYVPFLNDLHRDHRALYHAFSVVWRPYTPLGRKIRAVYAYEVVSETHLNFPYVEQGFSPNIWMDVSDYLETKLTALQCYESQLQPHPSARTVEAVQALAVWRGSQVGVAAAEAFVLVRKVA